MLESLAQVGMVMGQNLDSILCGLIGLAAGYDAPRFGAKIRFNPMHYLADCFFNKEDDMYSFNHSILSELGFASIAFSGVVATSGVPASGDSLMAIPKRGTMMLTGLEG